MKTITDDAYKKADPEDKFSYANDPLGLERSLVVEIHHDLVASLTGYYTVVARMIEKTDPAKAKEFRERSSEVFQSEHTGIRQTYSEREIISEALSKEFRQLVAFADEWKATHKNIS
ncbi:MAG: hypothetical protein CRN43_12565 [Candidatus Nephrothrix sp. EaCA]|nr:MAG: hypothetical protein CRN43_12565 [Candidatus Nephrothrix sp. EaCA]